MSVQVSETKVNSKDVVDYYLASILIYQLLTINRYDDVCINDGIEL